MNRLTIVYFHTDSISLIGIPYAFHLLGHNVLDTEFIPHLKGLDDTDVHSVETEINNAGNVDLVFTYDFVPAVSAACENIGVKYLAWVYDCPQMELFRQEVKNKHSYISVFERSQYEYLSGLGYIKNLMYYPLAADIDIFQSTDITEEDETDYQADVSFLGRLYDKDYIRQVFSRCSLNEQEAVMNVIGNAICRWNEDNISGKLLDELIDSIYEYFVDECKMDVEVNKRYFIENFFVIPKCNEVERKIFLNYLAKRFPVVLYSDGIGCTDLDNRIILRRQLDYLMEMPKAFCLSKINLNITSKSIKTGIPQRVWDILAAGGFCLTNYQMELENCFKIGHDIEVYRDLNECVEKIQYYLSHEKERLQIAMNGYKKVKEIGNIKDRMKEVLKCVMAN